MSTTRKILLPFLTFAHLLSAVAAINHLVSDTQSNGFTLTLDAIAPPSTYEILIWAKHDQSDSTYLIINNNVQQVVGLRSNIIYVVRLRKCNVDSERCGTFMEFSTRTAPDGAAIENVFTTPTSATLFLEAVPGASEWTVDFNNSLTGKVSTITTPTQGPTKSRYIVVIVDLIPNTLYTARARISQILTNINFTASQSPYSKTVSFTTGKVSVFGRVILASSNNVMDSNLKTSVLNQLRTSYASTSRVVEVQVLELETSSNHILCHYELKISDQELPPAVNDLTLKDTSLYRSSAVAYNAAGTQTYGWVDYSPKSAELFAELGPCTYATDQRLWKIHDRTGRTVSFPFPKGADASAGSTQAVDLQSTSISIRFIPKMVFTLEANMVYGIEQQYLIKTCLNENQDETIYDRVYAATEEYTIPAFMHTIVHTTDPGAMRNDSSAINTTVTYSATRSVDVRFEILAISKAIRYNFTVSNTRGEPLMSVEINEVELDSSSSLKISTPKHLHINQTYCLSMIVTTRFANGDTAVSPISTFWFHTEFVTPTGLILDNVTANSFSISWNEIPGVNDYRVHITEHEPHWFNITTKRNTSVHNLLPSTTYSVTVWAVYGGTSVHSTTIRQTTLSIPTTTNSEVWTTRREETTVTNTQAISTTHGEESTVATSQEILTLPHDESTVEATQQISTEISTTNHEETTVTTTQAISTTHGEESTVATSQEILTLPHGESAVEATQQISTEISTTHHKETTVTTTQAISTTRGEESTVATSQEILTLPHDESTVEATQHISTTYSETFTVATSRQVSTTQPEESTASTNREVSTDASITHREYSTLVLKGEASTTHREKFIVLMGISDTEEEGLTTNCCGVVDRTVTTPDISWWQIFAQIGGGLAALTLAVFIYLRFISGKENIDQSISRSSQSNFTNGTMATKSTIEMYNL